MKAAQYEDFTTDVTSVKLVDVPKPKAVPEFAVVKVQVAAVNPIDEKVMKGYLKGAWPMKFPFTVGYDFAGTVEEIDSADASKFSIGDEVFAVNWGKNLHSDEDMIIGGAFAEYILIPIKKLSKKPSSLSFEDAAAVALVGTTAYDCLFECLKIESGSKLLILGGPTAVGSLAIQLAKGKGAYVAATTSTRNLDFTKECGADFIVNYKEQKWEEIPELKGFDAVFDVVGEPNAIERARDNGILKENGRFVTISNSAVGFNPSAYAPLEYGAFYCLKNDPTVQDELAALIVAGKLKVKIGEIFPFTEEGVQGILKKMEDGTSIGKNLLKIN